MNAGDGAAGREDLPATPWRMAIHCAAGALLAVLASDALGWDRTGETAHARGPIALFAPVVAAIVGYVPAAWRHRGLGAAALRNVAVVLASAAPPAWVVNEYWNWPGRLGTLPRIYAACVALCTILFLVVRPLTWLDRRAARARADTPIRRMDERAGWLALSTLGAMGGAAVVSFRGDKPLLDLYASLSAALACSVMAGWLFARDLASLVQVTRLTRSGGALLRTSEVPADAVVVDLGLGDELHARAADAGGYRRAPATAAPETLRGSPDLALAAARRGTMVAGIGLALGVASLAVALMSRVGAC